MTPNLSHRVESYSKAIDATKLNTVEVWIPDSTSGGIGESKTWVVFVFHKQVQRAEILRPYSYIHGGAWRDPDVDSKSFAPATGALWNSSSRDSFAGFASINYSLSPYPSHTTNPSSPDDASRNAHHARHVVDVAHALIYLQDRYNINNHYILVGHSAGATLAFQLHQDLLPGLSLPQPSSVLGIAGIYNFKSFIESHSGISAYKEIVENAFPDRTTWEEASPYSNQSSKRTLWAHAETIVISKSKDDELVEDGQASYMLERARSVASVSKKVHSLEARGQHDQIWSSGDILASLVVSTMGFQPK